MSTKSKSKNSGKSEGTKKTAKRAAHGSKLVMIEKMLLRKNGVTGQELRKATGWPAISVPAYAQMLGLKLHKQKEGRETVYTGTPKAKKAKPSKAKETEQHAAA